MLAPLIAASLLAASAAEPIQCTAAAEKPQWPTYHFFNNITAGPACYCSPAPCTCPGGSSPGGGSSGATDLVMEPLNDANAVFEFKGLFHVIHVMMQAGAGTSRTGPTARRRRPPAPGSPKSTLNRATNASLPWDSQ